MGNPSDAGLRLAGGVQASKYRLLPEGALALNDVTSHSSGSQVGAATSAEEALSSTPPAVERPNLNLPANYYDKPRYSTGIKACLVLGGIGFAGGAGLIGASLGTYYNNDNRTSRFFDTNNTMPLILLGLGVGVSIVGGTALGICLNK